MKDDCNTFFEPKYSNLSKVYRSKGPQKWSNGQTVNKKRDICDEKCNGFFNAYWKAEYSRIDPSKDSQLAND